MGGGSGGAFDFFFFLPRLGKNDTSETQVAVDLI